MMGKTCRVGSDHLDPSGLIERVVRLVLVAVSSGMFSPVSS